MKEQLLTGWNFRRILSIVLGVTVVIQSINEKQWAGALFGGGLVVMALLNKGCCGGSGCSGSNCNTRIEQKKDN